MLKIIYLRPGFAPPKGEKSMLVQCVRGLKADLTDVQPSGITVRVNPMSPDQLLAKFGGEAEGLGMTRIYFQGALTAP